MEHIPVGSASALRHAVWMITIPIASHFILDEQIGHFKWIAILLGIAGSAFSFVGYFKTDSYNVEYIVGNWALESNGQSKETMTISPAPITGKQVDTGS